jgi:hypothetical protein
MAITTKKYLDSAGLTYFWGKIKDYVDNKSTSAAAIETLIGNVEGDDTKSVRDIAGEVLTEALIPENAKASLDTLEEIAKWIQDHPDDAAAMNSNIAKIAEEVELNPTSLEYTGVYDAANSVRADIVTTKGKFEKVAEEVGLNPDTLEYTGVYATTNSVHSDIAAAKSEIEELSGAITDMTGLSYAEIDAALAATAPEVDPNA